MSVLCLSVTLLDGRFHGRADGDEPEWPPSPWRLFQALLAGAHTGTHHAEWSNAHAQAFQWLERRQPPVIIAPEPRVLSQYAISVPNNDMDTLAAAWAKGQKPQKEPAQLCTMKTVRPVMAVAEGPMSLHYLYGLTEQERSTPEAQTLCRIAGCLHTFGWGIDAAVARGRIIPADEAEHLPGIRWRPHRGLRNPPDQRRIPVDGSFADLVECHKQFTNRLHGKLYRPAKRPSVFGGVAYLRESQVPPRLFAAFELMKLDVHAAWQPFRQEDANVVAAMLRSLTCCEAKRDSHPFPNGTEVYVAGHKDSPQDTRPRFSYLVLPTIGHPHADGMIRRVLIAEPHGGDGTHADWARIRLRGQALIEHGGRPVAILRASDHHEKVIRHYVATADTWATVIPVILPGYDECKQPKAEGLLLKAVAQAGVPVSAISDVTIRKAPFWPGSLHPRQYQRPNYLKHLPAWHVHIQFREPLTGPLAIGAGRHCGLGVFAAQAQDAP